jgi:PAS fold
VNGRGAAVPLSCVGVVPARASKQGASAASVLAFPGQRPRVAANASDGRDHRLLLKTVINNMSQGVLLFDAEARLVFYNQRYVEMYGLSPAVVTPGCAVRDLLEHRAANRSICATAAGSASVGRLYRDAGLSLQPGAARGRHRAPVPHAGRDGSAKRRIGWAKSLASAGGWSRPWAPSPIGAGTGFAHASRPRGRAAWALRAPPRIPHEPSRRNTHPTANPRPEPSRSRAPWPRPQGAVRRRWQ